MLGKCVELGESTKRPCAYLFPSFSLHFASERKLELLHRTLIQQETTKLHSNKMSGVHDKTAAGTADENIPTNSNPMDNIHGTTEDISNKASGYKVSKLRPYRSATAWLTTFVFCRAS